MVSDFEFVSDVDDLQYDSSAPVDRDLNFPPARAAWGKAREGDDAPIDAPNLFHTT